MTDIQALALVATPIVFVLWLNAISKWKREDEEHYKDAEKLSSDEVIDVIVSKDFGASDTANILLEDAIVKGHFGTLLFVGFVLLCAVGYFIADAVGYYG